MQSTKINLPFAIGDSIHSIIGESVISKKIEAIRIEADEIYIITESGIPMKYSQIGKYYFFDQKEAEQAQAKWGKKKK